MTAAEKKRLARRARRYGHHVSGREVWTYCPLCHGHVTDDTGMWGGTVTQRLDRAMFAHLDDYHDEPAKRVHEDGHR